MEFKERISRFALSQGLSIKGLTDVLGLSPAYFWNTKKLSPSVAIKMQNMYPNLNVDWINYERGSMLNDTEDVVPVQNMLVPLLPIAALGGGLNDFEAQVSSFECEKIISPIREASMAITVTGDSMSPEYPSGSIVFVSKINEKAFIEWGRTYVLDTANGVVIKNVHPSQTDKEKIICRSINPNYADFEVPMSEIRGWYIVRLEMARK